MTFDHRGRDLDSVTRGQDVLKRRTQEFTTVFAFFERVRGKILEMVRAQATSGSSSGAGARGGRNFAAPGGGINRAPMSSSKGQSDSHTLT